MQTEWQAARSDLGSRDFCCGHCGREVSSNTGYRGLEQEGPHSFYVFIYICTRCRQPNYFRKNIQSPGPLLGSACEGLAPSVQTAFDEARKDFANSCHTSCAMICRKILMHIAHDKDPTIAEGAPFSAYVDALESKGYIPPDSKEIASQIRKTGNAANHELPHITPDESQRILKFTEYLLLFAYGIQSIATSAGKKA